MGDMFLGQSQILYSGNDVELRWNGFDRVEAVMVTFSSFLAGAALTQTGFAEGVFNRDKVPAMYVVAGDNHWWQTEEMLEVSRIVAERTTGVARVVTYGTSMGGYGACLFSKLMNATDVVALSPQYSIWDEKLEHDRRWRASSLQYPAVLDNMPKYMSRTAAVSIFYDPDTETGGLDRDHAALYGRLGADLYSLPGGGHSVAGFLHSKQLLARLQSDALKADFSPSAIAKAARAHEPVA